MSLVPRISIFHLPVGLLAAALALAGARAEGHAFVASSSPVEPTVSASCRSHDGDLPGCNASGCAYYSCSEQCHPRGTSYCDANCTVNCVAQCRSQDGDLPGCNASSGCAYYSCSEQCHPRGTSYCDANCTANCIAQCRSQDGDLPGCNASSGCAYYSCSEQCHPRGTSYCDANCIANCTAQCRSQDGNRAGCDATPGCAYYPCSNQCHPRGTSNCDAGCVSSCVAQCRSHDGDRAGCDATSNCSYYFCSNQCHPTGTPESVACPPAPAATCRARDGSVSRCDATPGCAYYYCSGQCHPTGTPESAACPATPQFFLGGDTSVHPDDGDFPTGEPPYDVYLGEIGDALTPCYIHENGFDVLDVIPNQGEPGFEPGCEQDSTGRLLTPDRCPVCSAFQLPAARAARRTSAFWLVRGPLEEGVPSPRGFGGAQAREFIAQWRLYNGILINLDLNWDRVPDAQGPVLSERTLFADIEFSRKDPSNTLGWCTCDGLWGPDAYLKGSDCPLTSALRARFGDATCQGINRAALDGFLEVIAADPGGFEPGVYTRPGIWGLVFGTSSYRPGTPFALWLAGCSSGGAVEADAARERLAKVQETVLGGMKTVLWQYRIDAPDYDISGQDPRLGFRHVEAGETNYQCTCADAAVGGRCPSLVGAFSAALTVGPGETQALSISVPPDQAQATFSASWPGSQIVLTLRAPSGRIIDRTTQAPDVVHEVGPTSEAYRITNPEPGAWHARLFGADVAPGGEPVRVTLDTLPLDSTPPLVKPTVAGPQGQGGWYVGDVTVTWQLTDPESGLASSSGCEPLTLTAETPGITLTCAAINSIGLSSAASVTVKIDKTPPVLSATRTPHPNPAGWNSTDVTVAFGCTDALSGVAAAPASPQVLSTEGAGQSVTASCSDAAGHVATLTVGDINIDKTPPLVLVTRTPSPNANGWNNSNVSVGFAVSDPLSGVAGDAFVELLFTAEGANQSATRVFMDRAGNSATATSGIVNIDKTPPEGYNQFDPLTRKVLVFGRDALSGVPSGPVAPVSVAPTSFSGESESDDDEPPHGKRGKRDDDEARWELRTFRIIDLADNSLTLVERVRSARDEGSSHHGDGGHGLRLEMVSLQYGHGPLLPLPRNRKRFEWTLGREGRLKELEQVMEVREGHERQRVRAAFEAKRDRTILWIHPPKPERRVVRKGLVLLRMATDKGHLVIEY